MFRLSNCTALNYSSAQDGLTEAIWNEYSKGENWIVKAVLQVWADRCSHGAHTENLLRGYDFNIRDERCLIRKADVAELKSSKTYQRAKPIWGNVCRTRQSQFWLFFFFCSPHCRLRRMCFRSSTCAHTETWKSQEWLCVCVFATRHSLSSRHWPARTGPRKTGRLPETIRTERMFLVLTLKHARKQIVCIPLPIKSHPCVLSLLVVSSSQSVAHRVTFIMQSSHDRRLCDNILDQNELPLHLFPPRNFDVTHSLPVFLLP